MSAPIRAIEPRHLSLRCVACGLTLREPEFEICPRCGTDFDERPPRSYAEMEGLLETVDRPVVLRRAGWQERRLVERWLAVGFLGTVTAIVAIGLALAAARG